MDIKKEYWKLRELSVTPPQELLKIRFDMTRITACKTIVKKIYECAGKSGSLLDIGAGDRNLEQTLRECGFEGLYQSVDVEPHHPHDFQSVDEVRETYHCITMLDIIEHVDLDTTAHLLKQSNALLKPGGHLVISTPNINHVNCLWRTDMTHIQQMPPHQLNGLLQFFGFTGERRFYRVFMQPRWPFFRNILMTYILTPVHILLMKFLTLDHAQDILVIAKKP